MDIFLLQKLNLLADAWEDSTIESFSSEAARVSASSMLSWEGVSIVTHAAASRSAADKILALSSACFFSQRSDSLGSRP